MLRQQHQPTVIKQKPNAYDEKHTDPIISNEISEHMQYFLLLMKAIYLSTQGGAPVISALD